MEKAVYYAIGDIHGEFDKLLQLHKKIFDHHNIHFEGHDSILVHLGDYVDRGPKSYEVVDYLMDLSEKTHQIVINLKGNHEQMMIDAYHRKDESSYYFWADSGGTPTIESYSQNGFTTPPPNHLAWMHSLKTYYWDKGANLIFVHAGIDPEFFPNDGDDRHLWTRAKHFFDTSTWENPTLENVTVVHGHTPTKSGYPDIDGNNKRINIDTGACYDGHLTAVILAPMQDPAFLSV